MAINNKTGDAQDALIDFLVGALRPFVKHWEPWMDDPHHGDDDYMSSFARVQFKDVRRARAALLASSVAAPVATPAPAVDAVPAGEVRLREALTPSAATKAAYHGEFTFDVCEGVSDAGIELYRKVYVPWDTVKQIMSAISVRAALSHGEGRK